jgi:hypothetical protein
MKRPDIFYSLTVEDIQQVATESLNRDLSDDELQKVISLVEKKMPWYDIIDESIGLSVNAS